MTSICMLTVWMGKFPNTFDLWKHSAFHNPTIDFYIITDNKGMMDKENVHFVYMTLPEAKQRFQALLEIPITLETPYKICDYKPLMGEAFANITKKYEFWGHMDLDLILGNIRGFLTEDMLQKYDKFFEAGCFILYRNCVEMQNFYKKSMEKSNMAYPYKYAFQCQYACYFDEYMGMNILDWQYPIKVFRDQTEENVVQDFRWQNLEFRSNITDETFVFQWEDGRLWRYLCDENGKLTGETPKEYMLAHIQKREMEIEFSQEEFLARGEFWIVPNRFQLEKPEGELYNKTDRRLYEKKIRKKDWKRSFQNLKRFGIVQYIPHFIRSRRIRKWILKEKGFF